MGITAESATARAGGLRSSALRRPLTLQSRGCRITIDPDGSVRSLYSLGERRALFGFEQIWLYKVQAGVVVQAQRPDWAIRISPRGIQFSGRAFEAVDVTQGVEFHQGESIGFVRRLRLKNSGQGPMKLRVLELADPTAAQFGASSGAWGSLGVNAFSRESHVAMDEVSDPPSARVVGANPPPSKIYMTNSRSRSLDLVQGGELPESTAGMSGQVVVVSTHEIELAPGESKEVAFVSLYNQGKLEKVLSDFSRLQGGERPSQTRLPVLACSDPTITEAAAWALSSLEGAACAEDPLDRYESLKALSYLLPSTARIQMNAAKEGIRKDGSLPHSLRATLPGLLETAVFLRSAAWTLAVAQDKKQARASYPAIKKLAGFLLASSKDFSVLADPGLPQGWRRRLGSGYPTGEIPELSLAVSEALDAASQVSRLIGRSDEAGRYKERSEMISDHVRKRLLDERGFLSLCRDSSGRLREDETIDMAMAAYRHEFLPSAEQAAAHRLLEKDFDTPYGPRCVPNSNQVYFNRAYGSGQLGGVWTRAVLAHALVCYRTGLSGIGSLALRKVAKLVVDDAPRLGGSPGEFPMWVDVDAGEAHSDGGDPVAAARFIEVLIEGELGIPSGSDRRAFSPSASSGISWLMAADVWLGEPASVFMGRAGGGPHLFIGGGKIDARSGIRFAKAELLDLQARGVHGLLLHTPGQVICLGNSTSAQVTVAVTFPPRAAELTKRLSTSLEAFDPAKGSWTKTGSIRVFPTMEFEATVEPNGWKVFRVSTP